MENPFFRRTLKEILDAIETNKKIDITENGTTKGICGFCGWEWDMALHNERIKGLIDNDDCLLTKDDDFGIIHQNCKALYTKKNSYNLKQKYKITEVKDARKFRGDKLPLDSSLKSVRSFSLFKTSLWWSAVVAVIHPLTKHKKPLLCFYRWRYRNGKWTRVLKYTVTSEVQWEKLKFVVETIFTDICWK
jgi:hypothetical protein